MASGTGERPLGIPTQEKALMNISTTFQVINTNIPPRSTRCINVPYNQNTVRVGWILISYPAQKDCAIYMYYGSPGSTGDLFVCDMVPFGSSTGISVTKASNTQINVTSTLGNYPTIAVIAITGHTPTITSS